MSMRTLPPIGWLNVLLGVVLGVGGFVMGQPLTGGILLVSLVASGAFMIWLGSGWDQPLDDAAELYRYGRPANGQVLAVEDTVLSPDGTRTAKLRVQISPVNESTYTSTRTVALPGGRVPAVGQQVTVKFDPNSRKNFVLLEENVQVKDHVTASMEAFGAGLGVGGSGPRPHRGGAGPGKIPAKPGFPGAAATVPRCSEGRVPAVMRLGTGEPPAREVRARGESPPVPAA